MKNRAPFPKLGPLVRQHFLAGMLVVIPFWVVGWIIGAFLRALLNIKTFLPLALQPEGWLENPTTIFFVNGGFVIGTAILIVFGISIVGWVSRQFLGMQFLELAGKIINRIPLVRSIYSALDQLLKTFAGDGTQQFNRVVFVEWPRQGLWAIAFVTSPVKSTVMPPGMLNIFIPTTPNPTAGFHMMVAESDVKDSKMTVEEAFRSILSLGIAR